MKVLKWDNYQNTDCEIVLFTAQSSLILVLDFDRRDLFF